MKSPANRNLTLNTSSVADIAFLMLSFFLMTTVIANDKGLALTLPEWRDVPLPVEVHQRNIFKIQLNSQNQLMVQGDVRSNTGSLRSEVTDFILNNGRDPRLSDNSEVAIVSLRADRGTSHEAFMRVLDEVQGAYYEVYARRAGLTVQQYLNLDPRNAADKATIDRAKKGTPMNISLAEPTRVP
jgi:biopolymer transport protein ExbD